MLLWIILRKETVTIAAQSFRNLEGVSQTQGLSNQIRLVIDCTRQTVLLYQTNRIMSKSQKK